MRDLRTGVARVGIGFQTVNAGYACRGCSVWVLVFCELIRNQRDVGEWGEVVQEFNGDVPFSLIRLAIYPIKLDNNWVINPDGSS